MGWFIWPRDLNGKSSILIMNNNYHDSDNVGLSMPVPVKCGTTIPVTIHTESLHGLGRMDIEKRRVNRYL